ncbi:unnamed protein product, partial [Effrenium voratum]
MLRSLLALAVLANGEVQLEHDDECLAREGEGNCALSAAQLRTARLSEELKPAKEAASHEQKDLKRKPELLRESHMAPPAQHDEHEPGAVALGPEASYSKEELLQLLELHKQRMNSSMNSSWGSSSSSSSSSYAKFASSCYGSL